MQNSTISGTNIVKQKYTKLYTPVVISELHFSFYISR